MREPEMSREATGLHGADEAPRTDEPGLHPWIWLVYAVLFGAAIPWYLPPEAAAITWLGFPLWVTSSLAATFGVALFTVFVIHRYWSEDE